METQILQESVFRYEGEGYHNQEPWREINNITKNFLKGEYEIIFYNITDYNKMPDVLKFVAFGWEELKILVYREPEVKVLTFEDYNQALELIKKSESKLLSEGFEIDNNNHKYKRIFFFKDIGKHKIKEIKKGDKVIKIGDFLSTCWGYDQTNVELFTVKKILGKNYLIIQEVCQSIEEPHTQYDMVQVSPTIQKIDIPIKAFISDDGYMHVCEYGYQRGLSLTDMKETHYRTNTLFGH